MKNILFLMLFTISLSAQHNFQGIRHQFDFGKEMIDTVSISLGLDMNNNLVYIEGSQYMVTKTWNESYLKFIEVSPLLGGPNLNIVTDFNNELFIEDQNKNYIKIILNKPAPTIIRL